MPVHSSSSGRPSWRRGGHTSSLVPPHPAQPSSQSIANPLRIARTRTAPKTIGGLTQPITARRKAASRHCGSLGTRLHLAVQRQARCSFPQAAPNRLCSPTAANVTRPTCSMPTGSLASIPIPTQRSTRHQAKQHGQRHHRSLSRVRHSPTNPKTNGFAAMRHTGPSLRHSTRHSQRASHPPPSFPSASRTTKARASSPPLPHHIDLLKYTKCPAPLPSHKQAGRRRPQRQLDADTHQLASQHTQHTQPAAKSQHGKVARRFQPPAEVAKASNLRTPLFIKGPVEQLQASSSDLARTPSPSHGHGFGRHETGFTGTSVFNRGPSVNVQSSPALAPRAGQHPPSAGSRQRRD